MQKKAQKTVDVVRKPILYGSWHGKDARRLAVKNGLSFLGTTLVYVIAGTFLSFPSLWMRAAASAMVIAALACYQYATGCAKGEKDASYGEIIHSRKAEGYPVETERSFHPFKGFFAVLAGCAPFLAFAIVFASLTQEVTYRLGSLPVWTESMMRHSEFGTALAYYGQQPGLDAIGIMRVIDRTMVLPFVNVTTLMGSKATLLVERLSPLLIMIVPVWYGIGYAQGLNLRAKVNTGIKMGDDKKKCRERKARRQRQQSKTPERLI